MNAQIINGSVLETWAASCRVDSSWLAGEEPALRIDPMRFNMADFSDEIYQVDERSRRSSYSGALSNIYILSLIRMTSRHLELQMHAPPPGPDPEWTRGMDPRRPQLAFPQFPLSDTKNLDSRVDVGSRASANLKFGCSEAFKVSNFTGHPGESRVDAPQLISVRDIHAGWKAQGAYWLLIGAETPTARSAYHPFSLPITTDRLLESRRILNTTPRNLTRPCRVVNAKHYEVLVSNEVNRNVRRACPP